MFLLYLQVNEQQLKNRMVLLGLFLMKANHAKSMLYITPQPIFKEKMMVENSKLT